MDIPSDSYPRPHYGECETVPAPGLPPHAPTLPGDLHVWHTVNTRRTCTIFIITDNYVQQVVKSCLPSDNLIRRLFMPPSPSTI